jgi:hypothetical protein
MTQLIGFAATPNQTVLHPHVTLARPLDSRIKFA